MRTISLPTYNRPEYLEQALKSIRQLNPDGYTLVMSLEPGHEDVARMCEGVDWIEKRLVYNPERLGQRQNTFRAVMEAFALGSELNIYMEDDIVLSPDALRYLEWWLGQEFDRDILCLSFFNYASDPSRPNDVVYTRDFAPYGFAMTREMWNTYFRNNWFNDDHKLTATGWDWSVVAMMQRHPNLHILQPIFSRANNVGREKGTHMMPELWDKQFSALVSNKDAKEFSYKLVA